jgi:phage replication-related protein YjqB (UPF0714/DUF867 family)
MSCPRFSNGVRYLVVGGYAVALHGYPRYTKHIDIWVEMTSENASNILKALEQFGFGSLGVNAADFTAPDQMLQLGHPDNAAGCSLFRMLRLAHHGGSRWGLY